MSKIKPNITVITGGAGNHQMSLVRDTEEVTNFLEFAAKKCMLDEHAVHCRLSACNSIFSTVLEEEDNVDYMLKNLDVFIHRFRVKNKVTNDATARVYKSRVKSSLEDYKAWSADPFGWERSLAQGKTAQSKSSKPTEKKATAPKAARVQKPKVKAAPPPVTPVVETAPTVEARPIMELRGNKVVLPIRPNFSLEVTLPPDGITKQEFRRIGAFLYPYCRDVEFGDQAWTTLQ